MRHLIKPPPVYGTVGLPDWFRVHFFDPIAADGAGAGAPPPAKLRGVVAQLHHRHGALATLQETLFSAIDAPDIRLRLYLPRGGAPATTPSRPGVVTATQGVHDDADNLITGHGWCLVRFFPCGCDQFELAGLPQCSDHQPNQRRRPRRRRRR